jgi:hypothetical protein
MGSIALCELLVSVCVHVAVYMLCPFGVALPASVLTSIACLLTLT